MKWLWCHVRELRFGLPALLLNVFGILLVFELIRPFRDLGKDGPLAMISWGAGTVLSLIGIWKGSRFRALNWIGLTANILALLAMTALLLSLRNLAWH